MESALRITPAVACRGRSTRFSIQNAGQQALQVGNCYTIDVVSVRDCRDRHTFVSTRVGGANELSIDASLNTAGEYHVGIYPPGKAWQENPTWRVSIYNISAELWGLIPYRGDLHLHTTYSDGTESPAYMIAAAKAKGLDFAAITDHRNMEGSNRAIAEVHERGFDFTLIPGEEVNYCLGMGHVVALNASYGISDRFEMNSQNTERDVLENYENMDTLIDQVVNRNVEDSLKKGHVADRSHTANGRLYGFIEGVVTEIHNAGGIAIAAHPLWSSHGVMDLIRSTLHAVVHTRLVDAVEVFGGMSDEENLLSFANFQSAVGRETGLPLLGCSDAHGAFTGQLGRIWTVVFSADLSIDALISAILEGKTAPCLRLPCGQVVVAGEPEIVEYTYFLNREFFPLHDKLSSMIGNAYLEGIETGKIDRELIAVCKAQLEDVYADTLCFGKIHYCKEMP